MSLYNGAVDECDRFASFDASARTITFVPSAGQNHIVTDGIIVVKATSADSVTIGLVGAAGNESINGTFTTAICAAD